MNKGIVCLAAIFVINGCSFTPLVKKNAIDFNAAVEEVNNQLLVTNILRARDNAPMYLADFSSIRGSISVQAGTGNITLPFGPGNQAATGFRYQAGPAFQLTTAPTFDVGSLSAKDTTRGLLAPIDPLNWEYYWHRNYAPALLLHLFLSGVALDSQQPLTNAPDDDVAFADFNRQITALVANKVYLNKFTVLDPLTKESFTADQLKAQLKDIAGLQTGNVRLGLMPKIRQADDNQYTLFRESAPLVMICSADETKSTIDERLRNVGNSLLSLLGLSSKSIVAPRDPTQRAAFLRMACTQSKIVNMEKHSIDQEGTAANAGQTYILRSADGVLQYLGQVLRKVQKDQADDSARKGVLFKVADSNDVHTLFQLHERPVSNNASGIGDRIVVSYQGKNYYVRQGDPRDHTLEVLGLVNQLINSNKNASEIPATKAVQIVP